VRLVSALAVLVAGACGRFGFGARDSDASGDSPHLDAPADSVDASTEVNFMFVTSTTVDPATLGAGSAPLAAADAICNDRAAAAGHPGTYVAWLSTSTTNARDRLGAAHGWQRVDGQPFGDTVASIVAGRVLYPPVLDELGADVPPGPVALTGSDANGVAMPGGTCQDYTTAAGTAAAFGIPQSGAFEWALFTTTTCTTAMRLYCFQVDHQRAPPMLLGTARRAFVTVGLIPGNGGRSAGDQLCATEATSAGLPGTFVAAMATTVEKIEGRYPAGAAWSRIDNVIVTADLVSFAAGIDVSAAGAYRPLDQVWIGAPDARTLATDATSCMNWTSVSATMSGDVGYSSRSGTAVIAAAGDSCNALVSVYCLQQ
jgi:hypothetical protein